MSTTLTPRMQEIETALGRNRNALLDSIAGLEGAQYDFRESPDRWSIAQILEHLALAHEGMSGVVQRVARKAAESGVTVSEESSILRCLEEIADLRSPRQAPDLAVPRAGIAVAESLARLEASQTRLLHLLPELGRFELGGVTLPHPLLGPLHGYQWLVLIGAHEWRHAQQIKRVRSHPQFPASGSRLERGSSRSQNSSSGTPSPLASRLTKA